MEFSKELDQLLPALAAARASLPSKIGKNATANTGKFKYDYVTLEEVMALIRPVCEANGLLVVQGSARDDYDEGKVFTVVTVIFHVTSGQFIRTRFMTPLKEGETLTPAQQAGIVFSYGRRYDLVGLFGFTPVGEDTDGNFDRASVFFKAPKDEAPKAPKAPPVGKFIGSAAAPPPAAPQAPAAAPTKAPKAPSKMKFGVKRGMPSPAGNSEGAFSFVPGDGQNEN